MNVVVIFITIIIYTAGHELKEVQIGNIISHNALSLEPITWKLAKIDMQTLKLTYETEIEKCSRRLRSQVEFLKKIG